MSMPRTKFKGYRDISKTFLEDPSDTPGWMKLRIEDTMSSYDVMKEFERLHGGSKITISKLHTRDKIMYNAMKKRGLLRLVKKLR